MTYGRHPYGGVGYAGADVAEIPQADTQTALSIEVAFTTGALETPVWEDITSDVRSWDTSRGRRRELERHQPGRATIVLSNLSRQYDSVYADGPHFGNLRPMRRVRIRETFNGVTYPVFDGFVDRWHLDYPGMGHDATATITATDAMKVMARTDLPRSVYEDVVLADEPIVYWRMDETKNAEEDSALLALNRGTGGSALDGTYVGPPLLGGERLVVGDPSTSMILSNSILYTGAVDNGVFLDSSDLDLMTHDVWVIEGWMIPRINEEDSVLSFVRNGDGADPPMRIQLSNVAGTVDFDVLFDNGVGGSSGRFSSGPFPPGQRLYVCVTYDVSGGGDPLIDIRVNDEVAGANDVSIAGTTGGDLHVGYDLSTPSQNWNGEMSHVAIYVDDAAAAFISGNRAAAHYAAGTAPWQDDLGGARADRILDMVDWPEDLRELDTGLTTLQSAVLDTPALEHLQKIGETEFGLLFIDRAGKVRFVDRTGVFARLPAVEVYGDDVGVREFAPDDGDDNIRNRALISRLNGAVRTSTDTDSVDEFGRFDYTLDGLLHRTEQYSQDYANLIAGEYSEPRRRITSLSMGPPIPGEEDVVLPAMLGRELGDAILVSNQPEAGGDPFTQTCVIEGIEHKSQPGGVRTTRFILSPEFTAREWEDTVEIGYAEVTANQGTFTTEVDLTGLSVDVTVAANRRIRITGSCLMLSSVTTDEVILRIKEGASVLRHDGQITNAANGANLYHVERILTPSAGAHTYKLTGARTVGTGNVTMYANTNDPAFILVEDIGPA
jgi:hypothetical protein